MVKKTKSVEVKTEKVSTVYIGKSLPGLSQYTVFNGGVLPEYVQQMIAKNEAISGLIVPVTELQEARKNINIKGHILNYYAQKLNNKEG